MDNIWEKTWVYCGHETQLQKKAATTSPCRQIGRQPMIMVRGMDGQIRVLYNRCPHRGVQLCVEIVKATPAPRVCLLLPRLDVPSRRQGKRYSAPAWLRWNADVAG